MGEFIELIPKDPIVKMELSRIRDNEIVFRHGHIAITNYRMGDNPAFEKSLSKWDAVNWKSVMMGGYYVKPLREFRINRGYDIVRLKRFFPNRPMRVDNKAYPSDMADIQLMVAPRDDFQKVAITFMACQGEYKKNLSFSQQMIDAQTGQGKAQPDDTLIPTPKGFRRLDSLDVGDQVYNMYGKPVDILDIFPQDGPQETYEVTFEDGRSTRCNPEHLWRVVDVNNETHVITMQQMIDNYNNYAVPVPKALPGIYGSISEREDRIAVGFDRSCRMYHYTSPKKVDKAANIIRSLGYLAFKDELNQGKIYIKRSDTMKILDIKKVAPTMQRCILIDDPDHVYVTENFIPTHNTYCGVASSAVWSGRCVVFIPIGKLLPQWKDAFINFTSLDEDDILVVKGSDKCEKIRQGKYKDKKVFLISTDTFNSYQERYGDLCAIEMLRMTNAHIKIVDEVHRDMGICAKIEALCNFRMNYYMSASPGRSDRREDQIFNDLFKNVPKFGSNFIHEREKHINIIIKKYTFMPTMDQVRVMYRPNIGLNGKSYEKVLMTAPKSQRESFDEALRTMFAWSKKIIAKDNKILILTNTVMGTEYIKRIAEEFFPGDTSAYYSSLSHTDQEEALKKRVIAATEGSLGTGADIKGIQHVYNILTYSNKIGATQYPGRGRKIDDDTPIVYVEFVNMEYRKTYNQYNARKPYLIKTAKGGKLMIVS